MTEQREHLKLSQTDLADPTVRQYPIPEARQQQLEDRLPALISTNWLWIFASWSIILINLTMAAVSIRDMLSIKYEPIEHWFMSAALVATIGGLVSIHQFIIKRK
jgi:hypothetical protein